MAAASSAASASTSGPVGAGSKTCLLSQLRRKIHTTWPNGEEMVEEYDVTTDELLGAFCVCSSAGRSSRPHSNALTKHRLLRSRYHCHALTPLPRAERRVRRKTKLGALGPWDWEVGEPDHKFNPDNDLIVASQSSNVRCSSVLGVAKACSGLWNCDHASPPLPS